MRTTLTREMLALLRNADSTVFRHNPGFAATIETKRTIRDRNGSVTGEIAEAQFAVESVIDTYYARSIAREIGTRLEVSEAGIASMMARADKLNYGFAMWHVSAEFSEIQAGVIAALRPGDRIRLVWRADGATNAYMRDQDQPLHGDRLLLQIERGSEDKPQRFAYVLQESTCEDNSARMIRNGDGYEFMRQVQIDTLSASERSA